MRERGSGGGMDPHRHLVLERESSVPGDVIGVRVRLENGDEPHLPAGTLIQILLDHVGRIDDGGDACMLVADDVGATSEVVIDELLEEHDIDASNRCG
jgi:hypothetical protein